MYDATTIIKRVRPLSEVKDQVFSPFEYRGMNFKPSMGENFIRYDTTVKNLRVRFVADIMAISNSIHKYYKGDNYSDFKRSEVRESILSIQELMGEDLKESRITSFECGVVLETDPEDEYQRWQTHKRKEVGKMETPRGEVYGSIFRHNEYFIKGYDKAREIKLHNRMTLPSDLLRIELGISKMRQVQKGENSIRLHSPHDLYNPEIFLAMGQQLITRYSEIIKREPIDMSKLTPKEKLIRAGMNDIETRQSLMEENPNSFKKYEKKYKEILQKTATEEGDKIRISIRNKVEELLNG